MCTQEIIKHDSVLLFTEPITNWIIVNRNLNELLFLALFSTDLATLSGSNIWEASALRGFQYSLSTQPTLAPFVGHLQERPLGVAKQRWVQPPLFTEQ